MVYKSVIASLTSSYLKVISMCYCLNRAPELQQIRKQRKVYLIKSNLIKPQCVYMYPNELNSIYDTLCKCIIKASAHWCRHSVTHSLHSISFDSIILDTASHTSAELCYRHASFTVRGKGLFTESFTVCFQLQISCLRPIAVLVQMTESVGADVRSP